MHSPIDRRGLLKTGSVLAALAAAPAMPTVAQAIDTGEVHPAECFHTKIGPLVDTGRISAAHRAIDEALHAAGLSSRQAFEPMIEYEDAESQYWLGHIDAYEEQLCRHFPVLAPALSGISPYDPAAIAASVLVLLAAALAAAIAPALRAAGGDPVRVMRS